MVPKFLAHRCWCSHTPLQNNIHGLHQSQGHPFYPGHFAPLLLFRTGSRKKFLHPTEQGKEQSSQHRPISKLSVLKSPKYPAFNLYCRQHSAAVERASPDLLDTPTPTVNGQCITFLAGIAPSCLCFWSLPLAEQNRDLLTLLRSLWPSQRRCYGDW